MKSTDLSGQKFGKLIVISKDLKTQKEKNSKDTYWLCKCDCGNIISIRRPNLICGNTKSCGCLCSVAAKERQDKVFQNEIGKTYWELTIIKDNGTRNISHQRQVLCKCSCGNETIVDLAQLKRGHTKSCGHIKSHGEEQIAKFLTKHSILFEREYSFKDLYDKSFLKFDFMIIKDNKIFFLIECNGRQHYEKNLYYSENLIKHDKMKVEYCKKNNIPLIIIKYNDGEIFSEQYLIDCLLSNCTLEKVGK